MKSFSIKQIMTTLWFALTAAWLPGMVMAAEGVNGQFEQLQAEVKQAAEWKRPVTLVHLAGYADVGYVDVEKEAGSFAVGTFSPIFHYQFKDIVMLEAELELELEEDGAAETNIDYVTVDIFMNDYAALVMGKFLSPLGQFRQNIHPSWINKLASAPVGFGHDEAAPNAEIGAQLRGGFPVGGMSMNYALYIGNGPVLEGDFATGEIEMIETPGLGEDVEGDKITGGRLGFFIPGAALELGVSAASGKASVHYFNIVDVVEPGRDYDIVGADLGWRWRALDLRAEYIKQEVGEDITSIAVEAVKWKAWYAQLGYRIGNKVELVARGGEYTTPHLGQDREQTAGSINYLFSSNVIGKVTYEDNENPNTGQVEAPNRWLVQLSYGF